MNVGAAWDLLKTNLKPVEISSSVPVNTVLSGFLATPGFGQGIYAREGVAVGEAETWQYTFVRTSGGSKPVTYNLGLRGDAGAFKLAQFDQTGQRQRVTSISLPLNTPVRLDVDFFTTTPGAHSAILDLDDPGTAGVDYQTMNLVIAADGFTAANNYTVTKSGTVGRNQVLHYFFAVPAGTPPSRSTSPARPRRSAPARRASCATTPTASASTRTPAPPATCRRRRQGATRTAARPATRRPASGR